MEAPTLAMPLKKKFLGASEAGPSTGAAGAKAAANDSDSESEDWEAKLALFDDGFTREVLATGQTILFTDGEDRARLMAMNDLDREMELYDRSEKAEELERSRNIVLQQKAESDAKKQAKLDALRKTQRRSRPQDKEKQKKEKALKALMKKREKAAKKKKRATYDYEGDDDSSEEEEEEEAEDGEYYDEDGEDDPAYGRGRGRASQFEDDDAYDLRHTPANLADIKRVCVTRNMLEEWMKVPYFDEAAEGQYFVRISVGRMNGVSVYRLGQAVRVQERAPGKRYPSTDNKTMLKSPYVFGEKHPRPTNKWLEVRIGKSTRVIQMIIISNQPPTDEDVETFLGQCDRDGEGRPTKYDVQVAADKIKEISNFKWTAEEVKRRVEEKRAARMPKNLTLERVKLEQEMALAEEEGNEELVRQCEQQLAEIQQIVAARAEKAADQTTAGTLAKINRRNEEKNFKTLFNRGLTEAKVEEAGGAKGGIDVFSRRPTRPIQYWTTEKDNRPGSAAAAAAEEDQGNGGGAAPSAAPEAPEDMDTRISVDLSLLKGPRKGRPWTQRHAPVDITAATRLISFAEYRQMQGL